MHKDSSKNKYSIIPPPKYEETKSTLIGRAGLHAMLHIFDSNQLGEEFRKCLPTNGSNRSFGNYELGLLLLACLMSGHDTIDNVEEFDDDELIENLLGGRLPTAKTMGNFLRRFEPHHIEALKKFLTKMGYAIRNHVQRIHSHKGEDKPHFKMDGTHHEQHGSKMEGCGWMKTSRDKSVYGYASLTVFDELGICYAGELLPAAHPKGNSVQLISQVLAPLRGEKIDNPFEKVAHISGDSAFLTQDLIKCCESHHATFTFAASRIIKWEEHKPEADSDLWVDWVYSDKELLKLKRKKKKPTECKLARWNWSPKWSQKENKKLMFPVVIKKQWRDDEVFGQDCGSYHYHAVATNRSLTNDTYQSVIEQYRPRADVENMIKEFNINFDAQHLPCLKQSANEVYLLFVLMSQNLIRWAAVIEQPDKPHFSKKIRRKLITSPGQVLRGGNQLTLRVKTKFLKEVKRFLEAWRSEPVKIPLYFSGSIELSSA
jgi:hypothetical protein